jgi:purine-binding chemotaxis protein CheW
LSTSTSTRPTTETGDAAAPAAQLLSFLIAGQTYGCPLAHVREILSGRPATRLPGAPAHVRGVVNVRGTLVTVVDLAVRLGARDEAQPDGHLLLVETAAGVGGCVVDAVCGVLPLVETPGGNGTTEGIVMGFGETGAEPIPLLDLPAVIRQALLFPGER